MGIKYRKYSFYFLITLYVFISCQKTTSQHKNTSSGIEPEIYKSISVPISFSSKETTLSLAGAAAASNFTISLDSCKSGFRSTANITTLGLEVYENDTNCKAKLNSFTYNSKAFTPKPGEDFAHWSAGETALFIDDSSNTLTVKILNTLSSPITLTDKIDFLFYDLVKQTTSENLLKADFETTGTDLIDGPQAAPNFKLIAIELVDFKNDGGAEFKMTLECSVNVSATSCDSISSSDIRYMLIEDTYNSTLSLSDAQALFPGSSVSIDSGTDWLPLNSTDAPKGGFVTTTGVDVLSSPAQLSSHPNLLLILEAGTRPGGANFSYKYFNIDLRTSVSQ